MRKAHITLLIVTAILAVSSAYSLAAMNQVFKVDFEWFSQLNGQYTSERRDTLGDRCTLSNDKYKLEFLLADNRELEVISASGIKCAIDQKVLSLKGQHDNLYIICSMGKVNSPEYRIKITDIAQRGNNVEVKVSINTPLVEPSESTWKAGQCSIKEDTFFPQEVIKIKKRAFPNDGRLYFVFKNQDGKLLYEQYYDM